ncbi:transposon Tf2-9 polyprotein [Trichonephila clavipes]|nr:transposon Tf2-9 polyprotein [Trichonephila clavipes]
MGLLFMEIPIGTIEQQIVDLLRQNQELIRALQIRDDSHSHKVTVQFEKFDEENENFDSFIERLETYLDVQNVPIANRAKVFVSSLSAKLYQLLKNLLAPDIPSDQTKQTEGEGVSTYIAELRALAMNCDYDKEMLNIMLRDVFGSNSTIALKGRVENEIDRLEAEGIIEKVDSSKWATPVVPVVKIDGSIRFSLSLSLSLSLCADYSVTLSPNLIVPQHS